jgi:acetoin utilization deacetylase AcuC-like enzyme
MAVADAVRLYTHPACLLHDTGPGHPERPERLAAVLAALRASFRTSTRSMHRAPAACNCSAYMRIPC